MLKKNGFTLIELMIVVAIIGILAAIAIPKFADLINKSREGATKGSLSAVRSAIQIYYGDTEGWFPTDNLQCLAAGSKYLSEIPTCKLPNTTHGDLSTVTGTAGDSGGWFYQNSNLIVSTWGDFAVNCTHEEIKGQQDTAVYSPWSSL
ncbi:MAG TPA: type II secretion system protein [Elusimicrobiales bacterium]|nr:type II secretion system protein [Elusimicrobiales bacterium]